MSVIVLNRRQIVRDIPCWLADMDMPLILVTARSALPADQEAIAGYDDVVVLDRYDGPETEAQIEAVARAHAARRIVSSAEVDVLRAARLREALGLDGQSTTSATAYRDKFVMKSLIGGAGVSVAPMDAPEDAAALARFANTVGFPLVLKPRFGGGSVGVRILRDRTTLDAVPPESWAEPLLAEAFMSGRFFTIDGLMAGGTVQQIWPSFTTANFEVVGGGALLASRMLTRSDPLRARVDAFVAKAVAALPASRETTAFHAEVFLRPNGTLCLCEIACRPGGCGHVPVYERAFGINLYAETLRGQAGLTSDLRPANEIQRCAAGFIWFPPRNGRLAVLPEFCPVPQVTEFRPVVPEGSLCAYPGSVADHVAQAFLEAPPDTDLDPALAAVETWWRDAAVWT